MEPPTASNPPIQGEAARSLSIAGLKVELIRKGVGRPILFLHPESGIDLTAPVLDLLAENAEVIVPMHPGFGSSEIPSSMSTIDDVAYFYLDFLEALDLRDVIIVGVSLGAWIAAEMAIKSTNRLSHLVLANAVGIKVGDRETRDIADIFALTEQQFSKLAFHDPATGERDLASLSDDALRNIARNREASARFGWNPYMHDPKLRGRLHRIDIPTLFLWGESDQIVKPEYGRTFCSGVPGARFELIEKAGHFPHLEQPDIFAGRVISFINESGQSQLSRRSPILSQELA
jgi:pimeloyl-ACP methyl ester carboxylesterase